MTSNPAFLPFRPTVETWEPYINRFDCFLDAIDLADISDHRKTTVFDTATALLVPHSIKTIQWEDLKEILSNHYSPKPSHFARHHAFRRWTQAEGEFISGYMAALRAAALHCGFRDYLEDVLLDQLVCGVRDLRLQRRLLAKGDLTLKLAIEESQAAEVSTLSAAEIQGNPVSQNSSAIHYDEASTKEGSEDTDDVNRLRQPKTSQKGNRMAALNSFAPFDIFTETWESYIERFHCFLEANNLVDLTGSRRRALFLNFCGKQMFDTARVLLAPPPLNSVTWEALMAKLKNYYTPTPSRIAQRHAFHWHEQAEGETVNQFMVGLRTAALHCEFKEMDDALLDQLVCGLKDLRIQCRLLAKPDLML
ncbi:hypothetical protein E2320_007002 [Naja naja]|nr:hypothetical protein E2320_007002 [Naja naja]